MKKVKIGFIVVLLFAMAAYLMFVKKDTKCATFVEEKKSKRGRGNEEEANRDFNFDSEYNEGQYNWPDRTSK